MKRGIFHLFISLVSPYKVPRFKIKLNRHEILFIYSVKGQYQLKDSLHSLMNKHNGNLFAKIVHDARSATEQLIIDLMEEERKKDDFVPFRNDLQKNILVRDNRA